MERTKEPTRDYPSLSRTPWTLWETLYARRSHRKYLPMDRDAGLEKRLRETLSLAVTVRGAEEGDLLPVTEPARVEEVKRRAHRGAPNKINLWLSRAPVYGFLALAVPAEDVRSDTPRRLMRAAVAAQDTVLWLTENGLGTCWLGGINQEEVRRALGLGTGTVVPALVSFGRPKPRVRAADFDHLVYRTISRHRKPLSAVACWQKLENPFSVDKEEPAVVSASPTQDVAGLLRRIREGASGDADVPLELGLEACLEAARMAPSAGNAQRWRFVALTGEGNLAEVAEACGAGERWRAAVVGLGRPGGWEATFFEKPFWMVDLPIAFSHLTLMAASLGWPVDLRLDGYDAVRVSRAVGATPEFRPAGIMGVM
ncbi:nitroreductase family protein [Candidatus Solincola tengchongensis]|uniref:nitroreductase family protein n=1 Tax=Candidatus Solincola tengchongensis TaxID=2900693 RepID=UPI00257F1688|nr:nitroreductase family protein [Candidatus Solincola tengchongensis]